VLAAIAIPAFLNQREGAWKSQVESDLKNAALAAETYSMDHNGSFKDLDEGDITSSTDWKNAGFNATTDVTIEADISTDFNSYTLVGKHKSLAGETFTYDSTTGKIVD